MDHNPKKEKTTNCSKLKFFFSVLIYYYIIIIIYYIIIILYQRSNGKRKKFFFLPTVIFPFYGKSGLWLTKKVNQRLFWTKLGFCTIIIPNFLKTLPHKLSKTFSINIVFWQWHNFVHGAAISFAVVGIGTMPYGPTNCVGVAERFGAREKLVVQNWKYVIT